MRCKLTPPHGRLVSWTFATGRGNPGGLVYSSRLPAGQPVEPPLPLAGEGWGEGGLRAGPHPVGLRRLGLSRKRERRSSVRRIHRDVARELAFPAGAVVEELVLVV